MGPLQPPRPPVPLGPGALGPRGVGPGQSPYTPPTQAQTAPPNQGVSIAAGIADFITNYQRGRQAEEDRNKQDFLNDVQLMTLGIPVDHTKMAKKAKLAGMDLDFEGNNVATQPGMSQAMPPGTQPQQAIPSSTPGGPPPIDPAAMQQMLTSQAQVASDAAPPYTQPKQGIMSKIGQGLGLTAGPINPASSGMAWLSQLAEQGKETARQGQKEQQLTGQQQYVKGAMLDIMQKAVTGDPHALELASRFPEPYGLKSMPFDGLLSLGRMSGQPDTSTAKAVIYHALGGPQTLQHFQTLAEKIAPHVGGFANASKYLQDVTNTGFSNIQYGTTPEENLKVMEESRKMMEEIPDAPPNLIMTYGLLKANGMEKPANDLLTSLSKQFRTKGRIAQEQFNITNQYHKDELAARLRMHYESLNLEAQKTMLEAAGRDGQIAFEMINNKDPSGPTQEAMRATGYQMLASALSKKGELNMSYRGADGKLHSAPLGPGEMSVANIQHWFKKDENLLNFTGAPNGKMPWLNQGQAASGQDGGVGQTIEEVIKKGQKWLEEQLTDYSKVN